MSNLHRLQWIDAQVRAGRYPNAGGLANAFEISHRQALRDFEYLRDTLGAPLEYSAQHRGYRYTTDAFTLPGPYVTPEQRQMLSHLAAYYAGLVQSDQRAGQVYAPMAALFERLGAAARRDAVMPIPGVAPSLPYRAILRLPGGLPEPLRPYWRGDVEPGKAVCEFTDPGGFLRALLGSWSPAGIEWPGWLRRQLESYLQNMLQAQSGMTRHVTPPLVSSPRPNTFERMISMAKRVQTPSRFHPSWTSYAGAAHGILTGSGMTDLKFEQFMGVSGMAFHLIMHEECCISSVTVYDWIYQHQTALERLGVLTEVFQAMPGSPTFDAACHRAVVNIKAAIDRGAGVLLWGVDTGEFGVVYGYDDEDGVFLVDGVGKCGGPGSDPILYENVGRTFAGAPILHYQIPVEKVEIDPGQAYRSSLEFYVRHMESPYHVSPQYQAGLKAYDNWIRALETGKYSSTGLLYNLTVYAQAKRCAAAYAADLASEWKGVAGLAEVADRFVQIADVYGQMMMVTAHDEMQAPSEWGAVTTEQAAALLPLVRRARALEAEAVSIVKHGLSGK